MSRLVRQLLFMFGPLILRQVTKAWRSKNKQQQWNTPDSHKAPRQSNRNRRPEPEVIEVEPVLSEEERNFRLEEEDIMLEEKDLKYTKQEKIEGLEELDNTL